ncbi:hypothetical protein LAB1_29670 [Roseibium sp. LAB1]
MAWSGSGTMGITLHMGAQSALANHTIACKSPSWPKRQCEAGGNSDNEIGGTQSTK